MWEVSIAQTWSCCTSLLEKKESDSEDIFSERCGASVVVFGLSQLSSLQGDSIWSSRPQRVISEAESLTRVCFGDDKNRVRDSRRAF